MKNRVSEKKINKIIRTIILTLVIGTPLLYARFVYNPWFISIMKITFIQVLVIIAASLYLLTEGKYKLVKSGLNYPIVAYIIACSISLFSSVDIYISVYSLFTIILLAGLYVLVSNVIKERKQIRKIMVSLIFVSGFISIYSIVQYFGVDLLNLKVVRSGSISGPFENRNVLASFLVFVMPVSAGFLFEKSSKKLKIMIGLVTIITLIALIYTRTRGAWVGFMGAMAFFAGAKLMAEGGMKKIFKSLFSKKSLIIISLMVICLGLLIRYDYSKKRHSFTKKFLSIADLKNPATRHRFVMWRTGIDIIKEHPLLGTGMGTFKKIHPKYQSKYLRTKKYGRFKGLSKFIHNDYLEITTNTGILGLGTFLWLIVTFYRTGLKRLKQISESKYSPNLLIIILSSLTAVLIHSFFHYSFYLPTTGMLFWLWLGLLNTDGPKLEKTKENIRPSIIRQSATVLITILLLVWVTKPFMASLYFDRAGYYRRSGDYNKAIVMYKKCMKFNPSDEKAHNNLGNVYRDIGLYREALKEYERALKINSCSAEAHNNLGILYVNRGLYDEAINEYMLAIEINPNLAGVRNNLGNTYRKKGLYLKALEEYQEAVSLDRRFVEAYNNLGVTLAEMGKLREAVRQFRKALKCKPNYERARSNLKKVREILRQKRHLARVHNNLGNRYRKKGRYGRALKEYRKAIKIDRWFAETHNNLGLTFADMEKLGSAVRNFRKALKVNPNYEQARSNLEKVREILKQKPHLAEMHNNLGNTYREKGLYGKALNEYKDAIAINPSFAEAHNNLGLTFADMGKLEKALQRFRKALKINPNYEQARSNLEKAKEILEQK
ncbi:Photosystem I assembly protein Ycf3 [subsurface metagenome]